jgi:phosphoribosylglycinamide formyltransferase 1
VDRPLQLAVLISGRGSNMLAIAQACAAGRLAARLVLVAADRTDAPGLAAAKALGLQTAAIPWQGRAAFEAALTKRLDALQPDLIVLAGFMRVLSASFAGRYTGRMINIHPSLLPRHKGLNTHRRVLATGDAVHGASVHFVTADLDSGPVVLQSQVPVLAGDTEEALAARVLATEHRIYPQVIGWIAGGRLSLRDGQPWLDGRPLSSPVVEEQHAGS